MKTYNHQVTIKQLKDFADGTDEPSAELSALIDKVLEEFDGKPVEIKIQIVDGE